MISSAGWGIYKRREERGERREESEVRNEE
jgi:hypothetical protein